MATGTDKLQELSRHIKEEIIKPAEAEREKILAEAKAEKEKMLKEAKEEAERIVKEAEDRAKELKNSVEAELRLAAKNTLNELKKSVVERFFKEVEDLTASSIKGEDYLKELLKKVVTLYTEKGFSEEIEVTVPADMKESIAKFFEAEFEKTASKGIKLGEGGDVKAGFTLFFKDSKFKFDFSDEAMLTLLRSFLTEEIRNFLFEE